MAEQRRKYYSNSKQREFTPEERRIIERRKRAARVRERQHRNAVIAVLATVAVAVTCLCVWYFGYVKPYDSYEAQMRLGFEKFKVKHYDDAEQAFRNALAKRPNDPDAMVALGDTFAAEESYADAITCMKALQGINDKDTRSYERLITWYAEGTKDVDAANRQIVAAFEKELPLTNELVRPAPVFSPDPGDYSESEQISIRADAGLTVYFSTDGSIPTTALGQKYEDKLSMANNQSVTYTAASYNKDGLMSWPARAVYTLSIVYSVDKSGFKQIGRKARDIMGDVGPLYYDSARGGGYCYYDGNEVAYYMFPSDYFAYVTQPEPDPTVVDETGAVIIPAPVTVTIDPEVDPLPPDAVCSAVFMKVSDYVLGMDGEIGVADFMTGIGVAKYNVDRNDEDGVYHLTYRSGKHKYDMSLKDRSTISPDGELLVKKK